MHRLCLSTLVLLSLLLASCAGPRAATPGVDPLGEPPEDFTIDLTILSQPRPRAPRPTEAHLRPARIVLFADGSLHYGEEDFRSGGSANWLPDLTRRLSREQVARVWALSRQLGFANPELGEPPVNFNLIAPQPGRVSYLLAFTGGDDRWMFIRSSALDEEPDPAMVELVRTLAGLAWATDLPEQSGIMPAMRRYDFGPDPYARFRRQPD